MPKPQGNLVEHLELDGIAGITQARADCRFSRRVTPAAAVPTRGGLA
jgi:hypothetical protein